jgi:hypothetical protein
MGSNINKIIIGNNELRSIWKGRTLWVSADDIANTVGISCKSSLIRGVHPENIQRMDMGGTRSEKVITDIETIIFISKSKSLPKGNSNCQRIVSAIVRERETHLMQGVNKNGESINNAFSIFSAVCEALSKRNYSTQESEEAANRVALKETGVNVLDIIKG